MLTRRLGMGLAAMLTAAPMAMLVVACGTTIVTPSPVPAPTATWDPRRDEVDQAQAVWEAEQPGTYAYTSTRSGSGPGTGGSFRVSGMDGRVELQRLSGADGDGRSMTVEALFDAARKALDGAGALSLDIDRTYGYPAGLEYVAATADGSWSQAITEFTTAGTATSPARARAALERVLQSWDAGRSAAWEYTWTRFGAADTGATTTAWRVRHEDGTTTVSTADGSVHAAPPAAVTVEGTVAALAGVLAAGGWVDVSADMTNGLNLLAAVDPSPSAKGDAYWIRIDYTDLAAEKAAKALAAARDRWAGAAPKRYSYTWRYEGPDASWSYRVSMNGDKATIKPGRGAPPVEGSFAAPRVPEMFSLIERVLAGGGSVTATYDKKRGYPARIVLPAATEAAPKGVITITGFKAK